MEVKIKDKEDLKMHFVRNDNKTSKRISMHKSNKTMNLEHGKRAKTE